MERELRQSIAQQEMVQERLAEAGCRARHVPVCPIACDQWGPGSIVRRAFEPAGSSVTVVATRESESVPLAAPPRADTLTGGEACGRGRRVGAGAAGRARHSDDRSDAV